MNFQLTNFLLVYLFVVIGSNVLFIHNKCSKTVVCMNLVALQLCECDGKSSQVLSTIDRLLIVFCYVEFSNTAF